MVMLFLFELYTKETPDTRRKIHGLYKWRLNPDSWLYPGLSRDRK